MKRISYCFVVIGFITVIIVVACWVFTPTTVMVLRHAEKAGPSTDPNPPLTQEGQDRADALAQLVQDAGISAIYVSQYQRTQLTAQPSSDLLQIPWVQIDHQNLNGLSNQILSHHGGETVLVVGHSDTVPQIVDELGGDPLIATIDEGEFDNLFIVTRYQFNRAVVTHLNYGVPD